MAEYSVPYIGRSANSKESLRRRVVLQCNVEETLSTISLKKSFLGEGVLENTNRRCEFSSSMRVIMK